MAERGRGVIVITGWLRFHPDDLDAALPGARAVTLATRAEDGCLEYAYARDLDDPGMLRITERWRDMAALEAHFRAPHMAEWQRRRSALRLLERKVTAYEIAAERDL